MNLNLKEQGFTIEILTLRDIRENKEWHHPSFLVDWLSAKDIHVIFCNGIHCGMFGIWKPEDCEREILRLAEHPGFPSRQNLSCPVFTGNKIE